MKKRIFPIVRGRCRDCLCTDDRACPEGCCWVDEEQTICSACVDPITMPATNRGQREAIAEASDGLLLAALQAVLGPQMVDLKLAFRLTQELRRRGNERFNLKPVRTLRTGLRIARGAA